MGNEYLEIICDGKVRQKIDITSIKQAIKNFKELEAISREDDQFIVRRVENGEILEEREVIKNEEVTINETYIDEILADSTGNVSFYKGYLTGNNYLRISDDFEFIKPFLHKGLRILEIGAVPPLLDCFMVKQGIKNLTIVDPNASEFEPFWNKYEIKFIEADIADIRLYIEKESYDMIILSEVWEHLLVNKFELIKDLHSILKKDGFLFVTTPNLESISGMYGLLCESSGYATKYREGIVNQYLRYDRMGYYGHLREYTPEEMEQLFTYNNFFVLYKKKFIDQYNGGLVNALEKMFPKYASMGKYLFKKRSHFYTLINGREVCVWGVGHAFNMNFDELRKYIDIQYIIDSDISSKKKEYKNIPCVLPNVLDKLCNPFVIITLERLEYREEIGNYLIQRGISFAYYDEVEVGYYEPKHPVIW